MSQKLKIIFISLFIGLAVFAPATLALGKGDTITGKNDKANREGNTIAWQVYSHCSTHQATVTQVDKGQVTKFECVEELGNGDSQNKIWSDLQAIVNALSAGVGVVVTGTIIVGGIQYITAGDQSGQVEAAKKRIVNGIFALVAFFLTWAFLQWLIPGGVFKS